jgi:flagellar L-ring protein precursor FlgH
MSRFFRFSSFVLGLLVAGCHTVPPTNVHQPMTVRPSPHAYMPPANGSIYQPGVSRTLFEDRRARYIGDTMTIVISERTAASTQSSTSVSRSGSISAAVPTVQGLPGKSLQGLSLSASSATTFEGEGDAAANNVFNGNIAVTVIEVLGNGNLLVSGEKQVAIGHGTEYIRLSGVVNPYFISAANTIDSANVADARIEYKASGAISEAQVMGWLARFFLSALPF